MSTAAKGRRNEYKTQRLLEASGYVTMRAAASKGVWDVVGFSEAGVVLVQTKTNSWPGSVEMETMRAFKCPANCLKLVHRWDDQSRTPKVREV